MGQVETRAEYEARVDGLRQEMLNFMDMEVILEEALKLAQTEVATRRAKYVAALDKARGIES